MNPPLLSIVLPVFNVADFLPKCLDSLARLDPVADEIIAIDDGSSDGSLEILEESKRSVPQLRILRQPNSGVSVARNRGMALAQGRYLAFVDSDDFLAPETYKVPLERSIALDLDIMMFNGWYHFEGRFPDRLIYPNLATMGPCTGKEWMIRHPIGREFLHYPPLNLYRRDFLEQAGLKFVPMQRYHEDVPWTTEALLLAKRVAFDSRPWYYYRKHVRSPTPERLQANLEAIVASSVANALALDDMIRRYVLAGEIRRVIAHQLVDGALSIFHKLERMPDGRRAGSGRRELRRNGLLKLLWDHAEDSAHRRRIVRQWLRSLV